MNNNLLVIFFVIILSLLYSKYKSLKVAVIGYLICAVILLLLKIYNYKIKKWAISDLLWTCKIKVEIQKRVCLLF